MIYCLDTGPILDYLILRYFADVDGRPIEDVTVPPPLHEKILGLTDRPTRRAFAKMLRMARPIHTVGGVAVEVCHHVRPAERLNTTTFWRLARSVYESVGVIESHVATIDADPAEVRTIGLVDEVLLLHCNRHEARLVSNDRREMRRRAAALGVTVLHPSDLVEEFGA
jgi:hypothetical protein